MKMNSYTLLFYIFLEIIVLFNKAESLEGQNIIGGKYAQKYELKYQVFIHINYSFKCGGGIIDNKFVLTVAHCFFNEVDGDFFDGLVTIGTGINALDIDLHELIYVVDKIYFLADYNPIIRSLNDIYTAHGDISILEIKDSFLLDENPNLSKLKIPEQHVSHLRKSCVIAGHGVDAITFIKDEDKNLFIERGEVDGKLRSAVAVTIPLHECNKIYRKLINSENMCAQILQDDLRPKGTCDGDSGSPLVYNGETVMGILTASPAGCNEQYRPSIYTRVSHYSPFIAQVLNQTRSAEIRIATMTKNSFHSFKFVEI